MNKRFLACLLVLALTCALVGCSATTSTAESTGTTQAAQGTADTATGDTGSSNAISCPDGYPSRNIEIILPFAQGSGTETVMRKMCEQIEEKYEFSKKFLFTSKEGSSGAIGLKYAYEQDADGYTVAAYFSPHLALQLVNGKELIPFTYQDWLPVVCINNDPGSFMVSADQVEKFGTLEKIIEAAKAAPGQVSVGCSGPTGSGGRVIAALERAAGIDLKLVATDSFAERVQLLRGGHLNVVADQIYDSIALINEGTVKIVAFTMPERVEAFPDVPTFKESGVDITSFSLRSLAVRKDCPEDIYNFLVAAFAEAHESDAVKETAANLGVPLATMTPDEVIDMWKLVNDSNEAEWAVAPWA